MAVTLDLPEMYPAQHRAICDPHRIVIIEASTKSGKTAGCLMWLLQLAWNSTHPAHFWWVAPIYPQSVMAMDRMRGWLTQADPQKRVWKTNDSALFISLANGSRIWFKSADNPDSLFGEDVSGAVIDEATRCKEAAWFAIRSTLSATGGPIRIIGNLKGTKNWVYQLARKAGAGDETMAAFRLTAHDAVEGGILTQQEVDSAKAVLPDRVFRELYLAEAVDDGGNPFGVESITECVAPMSNGEPVVWGVDLAKSVDWTAVVALDANGCVCRLDRWKSDWGQTKQRLLDMISCKALIDSTGVGDPIVEDLIRQNHNIQGFKFTAGSKQQIMEGLAAAIHSKRVSFPDGWLRNELDSFEFHYSGGGVKYGAPSGMHDDGVCALALALSAFTKPKREFRFRVI